MRNRQQNEQDLGLRSTSHLLTRRQSTWLAVLLSVGVAASAHCGGGTTTVAEFRGGRITHQEFALYSRLLEGDEKSAPADPHKHEKMSAAARRAHSLNRLADIHLAAQEAEKRGIQKSAGFAERMRVLGMRSDLEAIMFQMRKFYGEPMYHLVEVQHLMRKGLSDEEARRLLGRLNALSANQVDGFVAAQTDLPGFQITAGRQLPLCASCQNRTHQFLINTALEGGGQFKRVPGIVAGGVWFVRLLSEKTLRESELDAYLKERFVAQAKLVEENRRAFPRAEVRGIPQGEAAIAGALQKRLDFLKELHARRPAENSFMALTYDRLRIARYEPLQKGKLLFRLRGKDFTEQGLLQLAPKPYFSEPERKSVVVLWAMHSAWQDATQFREAQASDLGKLLHALRRRELLASMLFEQEAASANARPGEVRRLYQEHRRVVRNLPGLPKAAPAIREDIRHRKQHVLVGRLRLKLRKDYALSVYPDRL